MSLNARAAELCRFAVEHAGELEIQSRWIAPHFQFLDFGIEAPGSLKAGCLLAQICLADLGSVSILDEPTAARRWLAVESDQPLAACMGSQYAGWQVATSDYFAMCSGPVRSVYAREAIIQQYSLAEESATAIAILETGQVPTLSAVEYFREKLGGRCEEIICCAAPTASVAGTIQIIARSLETACHKLHELGFDLRQIRRGRGTAPLLTTDRRIKGADRVAMGVCNDAILYGGSVSLAVDAEDAYIAELGPRVPSSASPQFGRPFAELLRQFGGDFYQLDPLLFAPAEIRIENVRTGTVHRFGELRLDLIAHTPNGSP
jgi:methenyltetrahydromethanopterin cyclohydrolase